MKKYVALFLIIFCSHSMAELRFYALKHQMPENVIQQLRPMLQAGETVAAGHNELIIRADAEQMPDLLQMIERLDQPAEQLLVFVDYSGKAHLQENSAGLEGYISIGNSTSSVVHGHLNHTTRITKNDQIQHIQVSDGGTAFIRSGKRVPVHQVLQHRHHNVDYLSINTTLEERTDGFYITPDLRGDRVELEVSSWFAQEKTAEGSFYRSSTTLNVPLGRWVQISGANQSNNTDQKKLAGYQSKIEKNTTSVWIKITRQL